MDCFGAQLANGGYLGAQSGFLYIVRPLFSACQLSPKDALFCNLSPKFPHLSVTLVTRRPHGPGYMMALVRHF